MKKSKKISKNLKKNKKILNSKNPKKIKKKIQEIQKSKKKKNIQKLQAGGASWWRVCYQWGSPRLCFKGFSIIGPTQCIARNSSYTWRGSN